MSQPPGETSQLIASDKVEGTAVYNRSGERLGSVYNFMVNKRSGQVAYAVLSFGGFLGMGTSYHPPPWNELTYDTSLGGYVVNRTKEQLEGAPQLFGFGAAIVGRCRLQRACRRLLQWIGRKSGRTTLSLGHRSTALLRGRAIPRLTATGSPKSTQAQEAEYRNNDYDHARSARICSSSMPHQLGCSNAIQCPGVHQLTVRRTVSAEASSIVALSKLYVPELPPSRLSNVRSRQLRRERCEAQ